jgi:hypothetical protein
MYINGTGNIFLHRLKSDNTLSYRSKNILSSDDNLIVGPIISRGYGLDYITGKIISFFTEVSLKKFTCSGTGKADNMYYVSKVPLEADFPIEPILLEARFTCGRGN